MKISVLTATFNRASFLDKLYNSLLKNSNYGISIEWLIMDDGSVDDTKEVVNRFKENNEKKEIKNFEIKYFYQENQGKMVAINNLVEKANGDLIVDCDSDDYFTHDAFKIIKEEYENYMENKKNENENKKENVKEKQEGYKNFYGFCYLKYDQNGNNMGNNFKNRETTMFDLYFKEGEIGEKSIVFFSDVRKKYKHELEHGEKFITEARMYHKIDEKYKMICINKPIMICEYQESGYTKNINKQFIENKYGYYEYFKEILEKNMKGVLFNKRLYVIKHYILFGVLTKKKVNIRNIKNLENKLLYILLYVPGIIKTRVEFKKN